MSETTIGTHTIDRTRNYDRGSHAWRNRALLLFLLGIALFVSLPCQALAQAAKDADFAGTWKGELGAGTEKLHIILTITKTADGAFTGQGQSVDQGATFPLEKVSMKADAVHFEVAAIGGVYDGTLNAARTELKGTWTQSGAPAQPLNLCGPGQIPPLRTRRRKKPRRARKKNRFPYLKTWLCPLPRHLSKPMENGMSSMNCTSTTWTAGITG